MVIDDFHGENYFLSNFFPSVIEYEGLTYSTVEHAYQAAKTVDLEQRKKVRDAKSPGDSKRLGRKVTLRVDWEEIKISVMDQLLHQKFQDPKLRDLLLSTGVQELVEGNWWHDTFWGVCDGKGENHLGKLLMKLRTEIV